MHAPWAVGRKDAIHCNLLAAKPLLPGKASGSLEKRTVLLFCSAVGRD